MMSPIIIGVLLIAVCSIIIYAIIRHFFFPDLEIVGDSMYPTLKNGERYSSRMIHFKKKHKYKVGKIYAFYSEHEDGEKDVIAIKRLKMIDPNTGYLWFEGDNSVISYDSRMYGYVSPTSVVAELRKKVR